MKAPFLFLVNQSVANLTKKSLNFTNQLLFHLVGFSPKKLFFYYLENELSTVVCAQRERLLDSKVIPILVAAQ